MTVTTPVQIKQSHEETRDRELVPCEGFSLQIKST